MLKFKFGGKMKKVIIDLRGIEIEELMRNIGENLENLKEGEFLEFIVDKEEAVSQLQKSDLKMEVMKVGEDYVLKVFGGKIEVRDEKGT